MLTGLRSRFLTLAFSSFIAGFLIVTYHLVLNRNVQSDKLSSSLERGSHNLLPVQTPRFGLKENSAAVSMQEMQGLTDKMQVLKNNDQSKMISVLKESIDDLKEEQEVLKQQLQELSVTRGMLKQQEQQLSRTRGMLKPEGHDDITSDEEFARRQKRVNYLCSSSRIPGNVGRVMSHNSGVVYCIVPKTGCTFWKRVFLFKQKKDNATMAQVNSIPREAVHHSEYQGDWYNKTYDDKRFPVRFIVTRDPFSRLLSSYLDKVYLPDFWKSEIVPLLHKKNRSSIHNSSNSSPDFLREHFDHLATVFPKENSSAAPVSTADERMCGKYLTFSEFIRIGLDRDEPHWMPIHEICNPCKFNVTHVSTMETFTEDARVILSKMGLEHILDNFDSEEQVNIEINTISEYNFQHFYRNDAINFYKHCLSHKEIAYRLWQNFQWRGYIDPDVTYRIPDFSDAKMVKEDFMSQVWVARKSGLKNPSEMKKAKKEFKKQAFATISKNLFKKISSKYYFDFQLFGYTEIRDNMFASYT